MLGAASYARTLFGSCLTGLASLPCILASSFEFIPDVTDERLMLTFVALPNYAHRRVIQRRNKTAMLSFKNQPDPSNVAEASLFLRPEWCLRPWPFGPWPQAIAGSEPLGLGVQALRAGRLGPLWSFLAVWLFGSPGPSGFPWLFSAVPPCGHISNG